MDEYAEKVPVDDAEEQLERHKDWARENGVQVPPNVLYSLKSHGRHYHRKPHGWVENVLLINRCGFEKSEEIEADEKFFRVQEPHKMNALVSFNPTDTVTEHILLFVRTFDHAPDGRAIFREDGFA